MEPTAPGPKTTLASEEPESDPATAGARIIAAGHGATRGTTDQGLMETETGEKTEKRTLLACIRPAVDDGESSPHNRSCALNACGHQGWGVDVGPLTWQHVPTARSQVPEGDPQTWQRGPLARGRGMEEEGGPPTQQRANLRVGRGERGLP